jgi:2-polyprenyl-6-methoxyphenol hydroxylase-like FAD-dependent oxidoreductase
MHRLGWEVHLLERAPALRDDGYMIDFFGSGYDVAEMMGLLPRLEESAASVDCVSFVDARGIRKATMSYSLIRESQGGRLLPLMRGALERTLYESLSRDVQVSFGKSAVGFDLQRDGVRVEFADRSTERADLVVGADGIHSRARTLLFGERTETIRFLGYHVASYFFQDDRVSSELEEGAVVIHSAPGRQLGLYSVGRGRIAALFTHRSDSPVRPESPGAMLREAYANLKWLVPDVLTACPSDAAIYYDVVAQVELPRWHVGRAVLLGDSCQAVSLLAGQGASMAVGAACVLALELDRAQSIEDGLAEYERRVQPAIAEKQAAGRRTADWFVPASRTRIRIRDMVMNASHVPGLRWLLTRPLAADGKSVITDVDRQQLASRSPSAA